MFKNLAAILLALSLMIGSFALPDTADAASVSASYSGSFSKAWSKSKTTGDKAGVLTYGYNTLFINEDFSHGYHAKKAHYASVSNGRGSFTSGNVKKGKTAKIEVRHSGSTVRYSMVY